MTLLAVTAALALLMSAAGVYGVVSHAASRPIPEIGVPLLWEQVRAVCTC